MAAARAASPRHGPHHLRASAVEPLTDDAVAVTLDVPEHLRDVFAFMPGQHVALVRPGDGHGVRRSYSVCSPAGGPLRVAIKALEGGVFSGWVHAELRPGDTLDVFPPAGGFTVSPDPSRRRSYAAIAAGSGITPILSILGSALAIEPRSRCTLVYGNRRAASIMFLDELQDLKDRYTERLHVIHVLSQEPQEIELAAGRIDGPKLRRLFAELVPPGTVDEWFLCGPYGLIDTATTTLREHGVDGRAIHRELFHAESLPVARARRRPAAGAAVTVVLDGRRTELAFPGDGGSILDAALRARPDAPYACKGGVCGTCRCRVTVGEVTMDHAYALEPDEIAAGIALACQARPATPTVVLDFDAA